MTERTRRVFRLIDVCVAAVIAVLLLAILVPALTRVPPGEFRVTCLNHQKNLGTALINYEGRKGRFPGWREQIGAAESPKSASWVFVLLPDLDRNDLYRAYGQGGIRFGFDPTEAMDLLICPQDESAHVRDAPTSFAVNSGMPDAWISPLDSATRTGDLAANGIFHDLDPLWLRPLGNAEKKLTIVTSNYVAAHDGTTSTILLSDRVEAGNWPQYGNRTTPGENITGIVWQNDLPPPAGSLHPEARINGLRPPAAESFTDVNHVRPSSFHPGGVVVTFADGHTRFISDQIDYLVYALLMTPHGAAARDPETDRPVRAEFRETALTDEMLQ